ncbi:MULTISPECIES: amidohydrolase [unclassified Brenneria]|uniref:amidohydrolase n=1 Tax=unclassified Brenneria TaxID=2634434 RepID=UPI0029C42549|nr:MULTISPECIES: amidohydrolase [unclassified Brenneria]MDX5627536.1 amidohydrolase [Brenneria sp. L3-3Z]MDX5694308.1 amidohydrolase [Brenneria sp. L4-2C]MEE3662108.1 amidohydrolase [Brenneria sp. g21c3]
MTDILAEKLIAWRRELHQYPELSNHEFRTTEKITAWLRAAGIDILPLPLKTGVVAQIGRHDGPTIALRADIDALPIDEQTTQPFISRHKGVMHACGHDTHTSIMLGAALLLKAREAQLAGNVRILFQPAEETFNGASQLIAAGALQDVSVIFGAHNAPALPVGTFSTRSGPMHANVDRFEILVNGKGAHAAYPEQGVDSIVVAAHIITALQTLPSRSFRALDSVLISVTRIGGGNTWNVLPERVELEGTVRTHSAEIREAVPQKLRALIENVAAGFGARAELRWYAGPPTLINSAEWADFTQAVAREAGYRVQDQPQQMGGEDFAFYLHHVPGAFVNIGSASEFGLHHPRFNPDEEAILPAARYFDLLAGKTLQKLTEQ